MIREVPKEWTLNAFPGAKYYHVTQMLDVLAASPPPNLQCVVIQVGINHRDDTETPCHDILALMRALHRLEVRAISMGISITEDMPSHSRKAIMAINCAMDAQFGSTFVYPLEDAHLDPTDSHCVHYSFGTQQRILKAILKRAKYVHVIDTSHLYDR